MSENISPLVNEIQAVGWRWMRFRGYLLQWLNPHHYEIAMDCLRSALSADGAREWEACKQAALDIQRMSRCSEKLTCPAVELMEQAILRALLGQPARDEVDFGSPDEALGGMDRINAHNEAVRADQPAGERRHEKWMIVFHDPDRQPLFFEGLDARRTAAETHKKLCDSWTCELFLSAADLPIVAAQPADGTLRETLLELAYQWRQRCPCSQHFTPCKECSIKAACATELLRALAAQTDVPTSTPVL